MNMYMATSGWVGGWVGVWVMAIHGSSEHVVMMRSGHVCRCMVSQCSPLVRKLAKTRDVTFFSVTSRCSDTDSAETS